MVKFVIVTGLSGAGKSQVVKNMEDMGFYCMDNIPPSLISKFADLCFHARSEIEKVALVIDIRGGSFFNDLFDSLKELEINGYEYEILFLEASDEVLIKRFKETRRMHPLSREGRIIDGIKQEREKLKELKEHADHIIDTSKLTLGQLKEEIGHIYFKGLKAENMTITVMSFGFKKGLPLDADLVFDVRFVPNPYYVEELRELTGHDVVVRNYVMKWPESDEFLKRLEDFLEFLIPRYIKEGKSQLVVAIGCTGGKHRSVTFSNILYEVLKKKGHRVTVSHRDTPATV